MNILEKNNDEILNKITINNQNKNISFDEIKSIFEKYGVIFFKSLFNKDSVNEILNDFKILENDISKKNKFIVEKGYNAPRTSDNFNPSFIRDKNFSNLMRNIKQHSGFIQFLKHYFISDDFFTGKTCVTSTHKTQPTLEPERYQNWHTDNASMFWNSKFRSLTFWTPLTDTGMKIAPGLRVCCKKFDKDLFKYESEKFWNKFNHEYSKYFVFPNTSPGDCLIFDCHTLHGTGFTNKQNKIRYSLDFRLLSKDNHPTILLDELIFSYSNDFNVAKYSNYSKKRANFLTKAINHLKRL
jgi:ectoine hydroxylase-related dioxygenase (phytanoyl-CoA dioxygenase family)